MLIFCNFALPSFDRMTQATLITANGTTLTLSDTENAELFWGICGGGSNFGVCTEFVLRLHPQRPTVFSGLVVYPAEVLSDFMKTLTRWLENAKQNEGMHMTLRKDPSSGKVGDHIFWLYLYGVDVTRLQVCITLVLFYNGSEEEGRENYKEFYALSELINEIRLGFTDQGLGDQDLFSMARKRYLLKNLTPLQFVF